MLLLAPLRLLACEPGCSASDTEKVCRQQLGIPEGHCSSCLSVRQCRRSVSVTIAAVICVMLTDHSQALASSPFLAVITSNMPAASESSDAVLGGSSASKSSHVAKERGGQADLMCAYPGLADERNQETAVPWAHGQAWGRPASSEGWRIPSARLQGPTAAQPIPRCSLFAKITTTLQQTLPPRR